MGVEEGTHLSTCLVYAACVMAFVASVNADQFSVMYLILLKSLVHGHGRCMLLGTCLVYTRDVRWSKFAGTGKERNAFPFKKDLSRSRFFRFFFFLKRVVPLFPIFLGISHPVLRRSFPVFSSFHLSKPVPGF